MHMLGLSQIFSMSHIIGKPIYANLNKWITVFIAKTHNRYQANYPPKSVLIQILGILKYWYMKIAENQAFKNFI